MQPDRVSRGTQAYASWAMVSKATQTGTDYTYEPTSDPPYKILTPSKNPKIPVKTGKAARGWATQYHAPTKSVHTQTPKDGIHPWISFLKGRIVEGRIRPPSHPEGTTPPPVTEPQPSTSRAAPPIPPPVNDREQHLRQILAEARRLSEQGLLVPTQASFPPPPSPMDVSFTEPPPGPSCAHDERAAQPPLPMPREIFNLSSSDSDDPRYSFPDNDPTDPLGLRYLDSTMAEEELEEDEVDEPIRSTSVPE